MAPPVHRLPLDGGEPECLTAAPEGVSAYAFSPVDGASKHFSIEISDSDASSYTLTATPIAGGRMADLAATATLTLESSGKRDGTGELATAWDSCAGL